LKYSFGDCEVDTDRMTLIKSGEEIHVEPQVFDLLTYLVEHRGQVVTKERLLDEIWGDRFVSESALTTRVKSARRALGDDGTRQEFIRTVHGRGYVFVAEVAVFATPVSDQARVNGDQPGGHHSDIPAPLQPLIGRDELLQRLRADLRGNRLLTLVGTGGVGKTSVGFELARMAEGSYPDGVHVVDLVAIVDDDSALEAFATALDLNTQHQSSIDVAIVDLLRPRHVLLLVDNCEHLLDSVVPLIGRILSAAANTSVIATSREPLGIPGEHVWTVDPLIAPAETDVDTSTLLDSPAVRLFEARAKAVFPGFELNDTSVPIVAEICRRLDGIPLAIELAAARVSTIDVAEIALRLDERFRLLKATRRGSDPRHHTLYDAISWSYNLLEPDERRVFALLTVFAGQFDINAAQAVCGDVDTFDVLSRLAERSMLAVRRPADHGTRFDVLETLREYGNSLLNDDERFEVSSAHASHFASVAVAIGSDLCSDREQQAVARADGSFADLRLAERYAVRVGDFDLAVQLIGSIREYAIRAMRYEAFTWADQLSRAASDAGHPVPAHLTAMRAYGAWVRGEYDDSLALAATARSAEKATGETPSGLVERTRINVVFALGRVSEGLKDGARQVELAEESGDDSRRVHAYYMKSVSHSSIAEYDLAAEMAVRAMKLAERTRVPTDLASAWVARGFATEADEDAALNAFDTSHRIAAAAGNRWMSAFARTEASSLMILGHNLDAGCQGLAEMVDAWYRAGEWSQQWHILSRCVLALERIDLPELATRVIGAVEPHAALDGPPLMAELRDRILEARHTLEARLGPDQTVQQRMIGAALPLTDLVHTVRAALLGRAHEV